MLSPLLFNTFFAAVLAVVLQRFSEDMVIFAELVHLKEQSTSMERELLSAKKTETMCMAPSREPQTIVRVEAARQIYKQVQSFTYLGGAVTEIRDMSVKIARWTRACWMGIRRYLLNVGDFCSQEDVCMSLTRLILIRLQRT